MAYTNKQRDKIVNYINNCIIDERLKPGEKLPAENTLAETLGVSRVTVRRALDILEETGTIERILNKGAFVKTAEAVKSKQIVVPFITQYAERNSSFFEIYSGVQDSFSKHNMQSLLSVAGYSAIEEREQILNFYHMGYKHMLVLSSYSDKNVSFYWSLMQKGISFVFMDKRPLKIPCDCVTCNNFEGAYKATNYIISQGHKRIALIAPQSFKSASSNAERFDGYRFAMKQQNLFDSSLIFESQELFDESFIDTILKENRDITALFVLSDFAAEIVLRNFNKKNIKLSVFGFDNLRESEHTIPALSTIEQPFYQIGYNAAQLLYERIVNPDKPYVMQSLPTKLIIRDSVYPIGKIQYFESPAFKQK